jgi:hypothetical protein
MNKFIALIALCSLAGCPQEGSPTPNPAGGNNPGGNNPGGNNPGGGGNGGGGNPDMAMDKPPGDEPTGFELFPPEAYTGFDGTHDFKVPVTSELTGTLTWSVSDPALATVTPLAMNQVPMDFQFPGVQWAMVTAKKAGTGKIQVTNGTKSATADLIVTAYTAADYTVGQTRYMAGCSTCHTGAGGVDHSPTILEFSSDADLITAITTGAYPDGYKLRAPNHMFMLSDAEKKGIMPYIRAQPPKGFQ